MNGFQIFNNNNNNNNQFGFWKTESDLIFGILHSPTSVQIKLHYPTAYVISQYLNGSEREREGERGRVTLSSGVTSSSLVISQIK